MTETHTQRLLGNARRRPSWLDDIYSARRRTPPAPGRSPFRLSEYAQRQDSQRRDIVTLEHLRPAWVAEHEPHGLDYMSQDHISLDVTVRCTCGGAVTVAISEAEALIA